MSLLNMKTNRPIIIVGKAGTGKTTQALKLLEEYDSIKPIIKYANEFDIEDNYSIDINRGILIEEVNYKPQSDLILNTLRQYKGLIILTSLNQKDVPKTIMGFCKLKRAGTRKYLQESITNIAPNSDSPKEYNLDIFSLLREYLKDEDRDAIAIKLKMNKPSDFQFMSWLSSNVHPNKIAYIDAKVKRKWSQNYFYELLAFAHNGRGSRGIQMPERNPKQQITTIAKKLGLSPEQGNLVKQLIKDEIFMKNAKRKLNNSDCRLLGIGGIPRKKKTDIVIPQASLDRWY